MFELSEKGPVANLPYILILGYSMFWWISVFRKCQKDRIHHFRCNLAPAIYRASEDCVWSGFFPNGKTGSSDFFFTCESHGFITGIVSYFNTATKDRRYLGLFFYLFIFLWRCPQLIFLMDKSLTKKRFLGRKKVLGQG